MVYLSFRPGESRLFFLLAISIAHTLEGAGGNCPHAFLKLATFPGTPGKFVVGYITGRCDPKRPIDFELVVRC